MIASSSVTDTKCRVATRFPTVGARRSTHGVAVALCALVLVACGSTDEDSAGGTLAPATELTDTDPPQTQPADDQSPDTQPPDNQTPDTQPTDPPPPPDDETIASTFDPVSGTDPVFGFAVAITTEADVAGDPGSAGWTSAGGDAADVQLSGTEFWVRYEVENLDAAGTITALGISADALKSNMCAGIVPIGPTTTKACVEGPFSLTPGPQTIELTIDAQGVRQAFGSKLIIPPIAPPGYLDAPISYLFLFDVTPAGGAEAGALIQGGASSSTVVVSGAIDARVELDCSRPGAGSGLGVVAYSIAFYDEGGNELDGGCFEVPIIERTFNRLGGDSSVSFTAV